MLYRGAIKFLVKARSEIEAANIEGAHHNLLRAQDIMLELMNGLDLSMGDVAHNLQGLYVFMYRRLVEANVKKDATEVDEVLAMLRELLAAWEQAVTAVETGQTTETDRRALAGIGA